MYLIPYIAAVLLIGGGIASAFGVETHGIVFVCCMIAAGCFYLFIMGCLYLFLVVLLPNPALAVLGPVIVTALCGLAWWNRYR